MYADPSARRSTPASIRIGRNSSDFRPSSRRPDASISLTSFSMCSMSSMENAVLSIEPDPTVLADVDAAVREILDQGDHAALLPDDPRHFRGRDFHQDSAVQLAGLAVLHRQLHPLDLVDAQDVAHDDVPDLQVPRGVAELDSPRRLRDRKSVV